MKERPSIVKSNKNVNDYLRMPDARIFALKSNHWPLNLTAKHTGATRFPLQLSSLFFYRVILNF